ncbi:spore coat U domain-containing protein [Acinetobacter sp. A47]|uniref:Csu type fimbrial protein n=1 Tax=Acinetobacter sp. A47 TaxID=1561217 RepID=UPI0009D6D382|nr:spore coat U domain-containing protein [Acinetobacter sp. A47]
MKRLIFGILLGLGMSAVFAAEAQTRQNFKVQATLEKGCSITNNEQLLNFGQHAAITQIQPRAQIENNAQSWNIRCTQQLPVTVSLNAGEHAQTALRQMKHTAKNEFIAYRLYSKADQKNEYIAGQAYALPATTASNPVLNFSIFGTVELSQAQLHSPGLYQDTVAITISW